MPRSPTTFTEAGKATKLVWTQKTVIVINYTFNRLEALNKSRKNFKISRDWHSPHPDVLAHSHPFGLLL
jgi:hypothetical protein